MALAGRISTELPVHGTADKWFHTYTNQLHHIQHVTHIIVFKLFGEDVDDKYKVLKLIFEAIEKDGGSTAIKRSVEYEKVSEDVHPPYGYLELLDHCIKDVDAYLVKAEQNAEN